MFDLTRYQRDHTCRKRTCLLPSMPNVMLWCKILLKREFVAVRNSFTWAKGKFRRSQRTVGAAGRRTKWWWTVRPTVTFYLNSEIRSVHIHPKQGSLSWVHGTMSEPPWKSHSTRNGSLKWSVGNWIPSHAIRLYIYISMGYGGHQLRLKCAQVHHHSPAGTFARVPGRCLRWSPTPPGPRWSPALNIYNIIYNIQMNRDRSFTSIQTVRTHTYIYIRMYIYI